MPGWGKKRGGGGIIYCILLVFILSCSSIIITYPDILLPGVLLGWAGALAFLWRYYIIRKGKRFVLLQHHQMGFC